MIPTLQRQIKIVEPTGLPTGLFLRWWQAVAKSLNESLASNEATDAQQTEILNQLSVALESAISATDRLEAVEGMLRTRDSRASGLTISSAGTDITVSSHTRHYLEPTTSEAVTGTTFASGLGGGTVAYVHYTDPDFAGGAVGYQVSTTYTGAVPTLVEPYRHFVGKVTIGAGAGTADPNPSWMKGLT